MIIAFIPQALKAEGKSSIEIDPSQPSSK